MLMHFVDKLVEVVLVARAEVDKGLYRLIRVGRDFLSLASLDRLDGIVYEQGEVCDAVIYVGRLVNADKWFVEDSEEISEKLKGCRLEKC